MRRPVKRGTAAALWLLLALGAPSFATAETEISLNAEGTPWQGASPYAEVQGTVDGHNHVTAYEFLGGDAHCGEPWNPAAARRQRWSTAPTTTRTAAPRCWRTRSTATPCTNTTRSAGRPSRTGRRRPR